MNIAVEARDVRGARGADLVAAARDLIPVLRSRAADTERAGRLPEETIADLEAAGLFSMLKPPSYGGPEMDFSDAIEIIMTLARGDASAAWVLSVMTANNVMLPSLVSPALLKEILTTPSSRVTSVVTAQKFDAQWVDGGLHVTEGVWGFNSGVYHSHWDSLIAPMADPETGAMTPYQILVPSDEVEKLDDWDVIGLRATGSTTVRLRDTFVPHSRIAVQNVVSQGEVAHVGDNPVYRIPPSLIGSMLLGIVPIGAAQGALEVFLQQLPKRRILHTKYREQAQAAVTHLQLAEVSAKLDFAQAVIRQDLKEIQAAAEQRRPLDLADRGRIRRDIVYAATQASDAVQILAAAAAARSPRCPIP